MPDALQIFENPYTNAVVEANDFLTSPFTETEGLFIPVISGGVNISATSFDKFYSRALVEGNLAVLKTPIYPFFVNALHYFAIAANTDGITYCIENDVPFMNDLFGKNPLIYALESKD
jgi:hypothetical protein